MSSSSDTSLRFPQIDASWLGHATASAGEGEPHSFNGALPFPPHLMSQAEASRSSAHRDLVEDDYLEMRQQLREQSELAEQFSVLDPSELSDFAAAAGVQVQAAKKKKFGFMSTLSNFVANAAKGRARTKN